MKRLLVAVLAFALFAPAFAVENVQVTGDIQTIGIDINSHGVVAIPGTVGERRGATNRVLFGVGADLVEDVQAKVTFAHRWVDGATQYTGESVQAIWQTTTLAEAYVNISNVFDALEVKVGRQFYGDEKSAVMYFGPDYDYAISNTYNSLDGATVKYNGENLTLTAAYFAVTNFANMNPANNINLAGLDLSYKFSEAVDASAYIYDERTRGGTSSGFWGVKPNIDTEHFKLGVEYAHEYGNHEEQGWVVKADLALPMGTEETSITPRATYYKSEKAFFKYGNYRPGLMFGSLIGTLNGISTAGGTLTTRSWEVFNAGLCMKFANLEKWGFGLDFYTVEMDNHWVGNSWEAKVVYNHNQYVSFNLTGAVLSNLHNLQDSPTAVQLGMNVKF